MKIPDIVNKLTGANVEEAVGHKIKCSFFGCREKDKEYAANCWNATLLFHGEVQEPRYCEKEIMIKWLQKNTIEIKKQNLRFGDIVVLWDQDELIHTAVIINQNKIWHKRSYFPEHTWEYNALESLSIYRADKIEFRRKRK